MVRRSEPDQVLSREQLEHFKIQLARVSPHSLEGEYNSAYAECRFDGRNVPSPAAIQSLVTIWRELRKYHPGK